MNLTFLKGILSLGIADEEVALIPAAITYLTAINGAKDPLARGAALAQLEGNVLQAEASMPAELLGQVVPVINAELQTELANAQKAVAAGLPSLSVAKA